MEWSRIETAPRDGTMVMLFGTCRLNKAGEEIVTFGHMCIGSWNSNFIGVAATKEQIAYHKRYGGYWTARDCGTKPLKTIPTHWMQLPERPQE